MKLFAVAILVLLIAVGLFGLYLGYKSSKMDAPELVAGALAACGSKPNCVSSGSDAGSEFYIAPLQVSGDDVAERLIRAIERSGGEVQLQKEGALQATFTSGIFRFVDDVQFSWTADSNEVDVRSSSRIGHSDMGANRKRVEALRAALQ